MNYNFLCVYDFETCSRSPFSTQPLQLCAVMIDSRRLEVIEDSIYKTYIKPIPDEECALYGLDKIQQEALDVNKITKEQLDSAPCLDVIWPQFTAYVEQYNKKKTRWTAPLACGFNTNKFDDIIVDRICGGNLRFNLPNLGIAKVKTLKEPYKFGPWDDEENKNKLFHPRDNIDLMKLLFYWFENDKDVNSFGLDKMREKFGIDKAGAHNAVVDVLHTAFLLVKFLKLSRYVHNNMAAKFNNSFGKENQVIAEIIGRLNV